MKHSTSSLPEQLQTCLSKESFFLNFHHFPDTFSAPWSGEVCSNQVNPFIAFFLKVVSCNFQYARNSALWSTTPGETQTTRKTARGTKMPERSSRSLTRTRTLLVWETSDIKLPGPQPVPFSLYQHLLVMSNRLPQHAFRVRCPICRIMRAPRCKESPHWNKLRQASLTELADSQHIIVEGPSLREWSFEVLVAQVYKSTDSLILNTPKQSPGLVIRVMVLTW